MEGPMTNPAEDVETESIQAEKFRQRYEETGDPQDLALALKLGRRVLAVSAGTPSEGVRAFRLATTLAVLYEATGDTGALDEASRLLKTAIHLLPSDHEDLPTAWANAGSAQLRRFVLSGNQADLQAAISSIHEAIARYPAGDARLGTAYNNLGGALRVRHQITGQPPDLDEAIWCGRAALKWGSADRLPMMRTSLAGSLLTRFGSTEQMDDLVEAIRLAEDAEKAAPPRHIAHLSAVSILASVYLTHFEATGSLESLSQTVGRQRQVVDALPDTHPETATHYLNLCSALRIRFERMGVSGDLDQAITAARRAWEASHQDIFRKHAAEQLAMLLPRKAKRQQSSGDQQAALASCDEALELIDQALMLAPRRDGGRVDDLTVRGNICATRYQLTHELSDARTTVDSYQKALKECGRADHRRARLLSNLGYAQGNLLPVTKAADLDYPISLLRDALKSAQPSNPVWADVAGNLAVSLVRRYQLGHSKADMTEALTLCRDINTAPGAPAGKRVHLSEIGGELAMSAGDPVQASPYYQEALGLLPAMAWLGLDRTTQETHLDQASDIATSAAACHMGTGRADKALELLEQGRSVLWTQLLQLRQYHAELEEKHPALAARLRDLGTALNAV